MEWLRVKTEEVKNYLRKRCFETHDKANFVASADVGYAVQPGV